MAIVSVFLEKKYNFFCKKYLLFHKKCVLSRLVRKAVILQLFLRVVLFN